MHGKWKREVGVVKVGGGGGQWGVGALSGEVGGKGQ